MKLQQQVAYIAGPMRGHPRFNFDAFYEAEDRLTELGYEVLNPARMDEELGFNPDTDNPQGDFLESAMKRDVEAVYRADVVVMLPGWEKSTGATAEKWLAHWRHIPVWQYPDMTPLAPPTHLQRIRDERGKVYGEPELSHENIGLAWTGLIQQHYGTRLDHPLPPWLVELMMVQFKANRSARVYHKDNFDDLHVYAEFAQESQSKGAAK